MNTYQRLFSGLQLRWLVTLKWVVLIGFAILTSITENILPTGFLPPESQYFFDAFESVFGNLIFIGLLWCIFKAKGFSLRAFWQRPVRAQSWYWLLLLFVPLKLSAMLLNLLIGYFIESFNYLPFQKVSEINPLGMWIIAPWKSHWYLAYNALSVFDTVLLGPFAEELFFRGVVLHRLSLKYGDSKGLWLSALLFGAFHFHGILHATLIGWVLGFVYLQTRNLKVSIYWHILHNSISILVAMVASDPSILDHWWIEKMFDAIGLSLLGGFLVFLPIGIRWVRQQRITYTAPLFQESATDPCINDNKDKQKGHR